MNKINNAYFHESNLISLEFIKCSSNRGVSSFGIILRVKLMKFLFYVLISIGIVFLFVFRTLRL